MFIYTLKLNNTDSEQLTLKHETSAPISICHNIEVKGNSYLVVSVCHCDKGVILTCDKL